MLIISSGSIEYAIFLPLIGAVVLSSGHFIATGLSLLLVLLIIIVGSASPRAAHHHHTHATHTERIRATQRRTDTDQRGRAGQGGTGGDIFRSDAAAKWAVHSDIR